MYDLVLNGGRVVDPAQGIDAICDIAFSNGKVAAIGEGGGDIGDGRCRSSGRGWWRRNRGCEGCAAATAELEAGRVVCTAFRTATDQRACALPAEGHPFGVFESAARAAHEGLAGLSWDLEGV